MNEQINYVEFKKNIDKLLCDVCVKINILDSDVCYLYDVLNNKTTNSPGRRGMTGVPQDSSDRLSHVRQALKNMIDTLEYCEAMFNQKLGQT